MEDQLKDQEIEEVEKETEEKAVSTSWKDAFMTYYVMGACGVFAVWALLFGNAYAVGAQTTLNINSEEIVGGFFDGANLGGLIAVLALPYGIQFAFNFIQGIFSKFSSVRFGG